MNSVEQINIQIHPRAFSSFGEDLVTNDIVAITELVKNSYDAYAFNVTIKFGEDRNGNKYISIKDDGLGMDRDTILNAWATIATPYKKKKPYVERQVDGEKKIRQVSGNKGLGRFSAARLGDEMVMYTKAPNGKTLKAYFDWKSFEDVEDISECIMRLEEVEDIYFDISGTEIIIKKLKAIWDKEKISELGDELSRLINPFEEIADFEISIDSIEKENSGKIESNAFINNPIYKIEGKVNLDGTIIYNYYYNDGEKERKTENQRIEWSLENYKEKKELLDDNKLKDYTCGKFSFEFRVWDLDADSIQDVSERFNIAKGKVRSSIKLYKGISVYRDNILVLPKSETTRDWLGLDRKRISQIGKRISTSQIIGIVHISNKDNPNIKDTTDREKLADTLEYKQFTEAINNVVDALQRERQKDKTVEEKKESLTDIIAPLSAKELLSDVEEAVKTGAGTDEILDYVRDYHSKNEKQLNELNERLVYYAQTASLGSVAIVIMHEFLTGMTCIKRFLNKSKKYVEDFDDRTKEYLNDAEVSHKRIVEVSESFAPLYKRDLRKKSKGADLGEAVEKSIRLIQAKKTSKDVVFENGIFGNIRVNINMSELQTVLVNILDNACFWMKNASREKKISIQIEDNDEYAVVMSISDTGCGILESEAEKIFMPGITSKPKGIGMGLVIVTEIVKEHNGEIGVRIPGDLEGATFILELKKEV